MTTPPQLVFRFQVTFTESSLSAGAGSAAVPLCKGAFSEVTGLDATMEPKVIKEGGRNYGPAQRAGPVTFSTVVLKRGVTYSRDLWRWFELVQGGAYAYRLDVVISVQDVNGREVLAWKLLRALPVKFKMSDLNAARSEVAVEEIHLAHEGLLLERPQGGGR